MPVSKSRLSLASRALIRRNSRVVLNYNAKASFRYALSSFEYSELALSPVSMWDDTLFVVSGSYRNVVVGSGNKSSLRAESLEPG
jgi:hypothetical protein